MQDRFTFRTWNPDISFFKYWGWLKEGEYKNMCSCREISKDELLEKYTQQCTGLRDKNGKLIFEGDFLKVTGSRDTSGYGVVEYLQAGCQFIVNGYLANPSPYHPRRKGEFCHPLQEWLCIEVIGNIYENPELLEEKC